jgi:hypothetical protein
MPKKNKFGEINKMVIIGGTSILLIVVIGIIIYFIKKKKNSSSSPPPPDKSDESNKPQITTPKTVYIYPDLSKTLYYDVIDWDPSLSTSHPPYMTRSARNHYILYGNNFNNDKIKNSKDSGSQGITVKKDQWLVLYQYRMSTVYYNYINYSKLDDGGKYKAYFSNDEPKLDKIN